MNKLCFTLKDLSTKKDLTVSLMDRKNGIFISMWCNRHLIFRSASNSYKSEILNAGTLPSLELLFMF